MPTPEHSRRTSPASDPSPPGAPSRALRMRAASGWVRFMRRAEAVGSYPVGPDGYERHPLVGARVRDTASGAEGELTAVTRELHGDGREVRIAHIRGENGVEWTASADNIQAAPFTAHVAWAAPSDRRADLFIDIPSELEAALIDLPLPAWRMDGSFLAKSTTEEYRTELTATPRFEETAATLRHALTGEGGGCAVLRLGNIAEAMGIGDRFLRLATGFAAEVAVPFSPFPRWPLWKDIGVKIDKDPGKSSGIGYNAFHMDLVNATLPPDYTTLLCVRPDPLGGGHSILSDAHAAVARLPEDSRSLLAETAYHYGTFFDLHGVGEEYKPFPVLGGGDGFVRFTAKMLERSELGRAHAEAARELAEELVRGQVSFMLKPGDYLIVAQRRFLHGREALAGGQHQVEPDRRRLLLQLFLRASASDGPTA
ncbi:TauD/TfdA family dioxygenase [Streptomyces sp. NPDC051909]|uniref:TauD/TfdA family dioxygenase n=1 Tax=Streptomyces sp. NPDC051909 TaxID=3154944 RepID=UPI00341E4913